LSGTSKSRKIKVVIQNLTTPKRRSLWDIIACLS
jgi:hypothetical protein